MQMKRSVHGLHYEPGAAYTETKSSLGFKGGNHFEGDPVLFFYR